VKTPRDLTTNIRDKKYDPLRKVGKKRRMNESENVKKIIFGLAAENAE
jgi:hypothetical protein